MLSKTKKVLTLGLSLSLLMPLSLSCRAYAEQGRALDTGCSRALADDILDPCMVANTKCVLDCYDARKGKVDTTPAFCGEHKIGEEPSYFLGCNEEFQKCMDKDCRFLNDVVNLKAEDIMNKPLPSFEINNPMLSFSSVLIANLALMGIGGLLGGYAGAIFALFCIGIEF